VQKSKDERDLGAEWYELVNLVIGKFHNLHSEEDLRKQHKMHGNSTGELNDQHRFHFSKLKRFFAVFMVVQRPQHACKHGELDDKQEHVNEVSPADDRQRQIHPISVVSQEQEHCQRQQARFKLYFFFLGCFPQ